MTPTYAIRIDRHCDCDLWYVWTVTKDGHRHTFGGDMSEHVARALYADLSKLTPHTIAWLVRDLTPEHDLAAYQERLTA